MPGPAYPGVAYRLQVLVLRTGCTLEHLEKGDCGKSSTLTCKGDIRATGGGRSRAVGAAVVGAGLAAIIQEFLGKGTSLI